MKKNNSGYTLIELLVVITIIMIIGAASFIPFTTYQQLAKLRTSGKIISQTFAEARNLALNGVANDSSVTGEFKNQNVSILFDKTSDDSAKKINIYTYDFTADNCTSSTGTAFREKVLETQTGISEIKNGSDLSDKFIVVFEAITGNVKYYKFSPTCIEVSKDDLRIGYTILGSTNSIFQRGITYVHDTNVINYD